MKLDIVNPWQRKEAARLLRQGRRSTAISARAWAEAECDRLARASTGDAYQTALAYSFIASRIADILNIT